MSEPNSNRTLTTVVMYATPSELCSVSRNGPDRMKIMRNRTTNQLPSTPIRIPNASKSLIEVDRLNMVEWSHRRVGAHDIQET